MVFLSATVVHVGFKCLLPWEIYEVHSDAVTIQFFRDAVLFSKIPSARQAMVGLLDRVLGVTIGSFCYHIHVLDSDTSCFWNGKITDVFVGFSRDALLDRVSPELSLSPVVMQFGKYLRVIVVLGESELPGTSTATKWNAFEIMAQSQKEKSQTQVPKEIEERNRKDKLYNHLRLYCREHGLFWKADEVDMLGVNFLRCLCDVLWYVDGHHHVFVTRGCPIPELFTQCAFHAIRFMCNLHTT